MRSRRFQGVSELPAAISQGAGLGKTAEPRSVGVPERVEDEEV